MNERECFAQMEHVDLLQCRSDIHEDFIASRRMRVYGEIVPRLLLAVAIARHSVFEDWHRQENMCVFSVDDNS